jgi:uncharacterized protein
MTISLYAASVPVFEQMLQSQSAILDKAEAHATAKKIDPNALLQARLFPDMFPLAVQIQVACDFARSVPARLAGLEVPKIEGDLTSFADLQKLINTSLSFIRGINAAHIDGKEDSEILLRAGTPNERRLTGQAYLLSYGLPQFFFHVTTAYAILRHNGIEIGKRDFIGQR